MMKIRGFAFLNLIGLLFFKSQHAFALIQETSVQPPFLSMTEFPFLLITLSALIVTAFSIYLNKKAQNKINQYKSLSLFSQTLLESTGKEFITIHDGSMCFCSKKLSLRLGLENQTTDINTLKDKIVKVGVDEISISNLVERLPSVSKSGAPLEYKLEQPSKNTVFYVRGTNLKRVGEENPIYVLWIKEQLESESENLPKIRSMENETGTEFLTDVLNHLDIPFWLRSHEGSLIWVNEAFLKSVDAPSKKNVLDDQIELLDKERAKEAKKQREIIFKKEHSFTQFKHIVIDGVRKYLKFVEYKLENIEGVSVGFALDLTEEEKAQSGLQSHKRAHAETLDRLTTSIAILGPDQSLIYYNQAFEALFELPAKKLENDPVYSEVLELLRTSHKLPEQADFLSWKKNVLESLRDIVTPREDMWHLPDGTTIRVVTGPHPLGGWLLIHEDVTDKLTLERNYNTLIAVQNQTLNNLHEGVAVIGTDNNIKFISQNFSSLWGLDHNNVIEGQGFHNLLDSFRHLLAKDGVDWLDLRSQIIGLTLSRKPELGNWELTNGRMIQYAFIPLPDGGSNLNIIDITDSMQIERALEEKTEALKAADQIKAEFLANMSYELKTPLSSIIGFAELLKEQYFGELNERQLDYTDTILNSSKALGYLIDNILDIAIIEAGKMELEASEFKLSDSIEKIMELTNEKANSKSLKLTMRCHKNTGKMVGDSLKIQHAIYNMVIDMINTTVSGGEVTIQTEGRDKHIDIKVISSESTWATGEDPSSGYDIQSIAPYNPMGSKGRTGQATLNLSLVKSFIQLHGGTVSINSEDTQKTIITCTLPRKPVKQVQENPTEIKGGAQL